MSDLFLVTRAELYKMVRRPSLWVLLAASIVLNQIFSYLIPFLSYVSGNKLDEGATRADLLTSTLPAQLVGNTIGGFPVFDGALALVFGALVAGSEYGWGTVKTQLIQRPARAAVQGGQLLAIAIAVVIGVVVTMMLGAVTSVAIALGESRSLALPSAGALVEGAGAGVLVLLMFALLGVTLAVFLRGLALPIGLGVVWVLGIENLVSAMASSVLSALRPLRDLLPGVNSGSLVTAAMPARVLDPPPGVNDSVAGSRALLTLALYVVLSAALTLSVVRRRDIT